jgi:IS4 transposase
MVSDWALEETASADFGDERLNRRYALIVSCIGNQPNLSIPAGCNGRAEMEATYRFTDNESVTWEKILAPHRQCTLGRAAEHKVALFVQDTTEIDLTRPRQQVVGAGGLDGSRRRGVLAHLVHVFSGDGTPLGTSSAQIINRTQCTEEHKAKRKKTKLEKEKQRTHKPIEQKESMRWLDGLRNVREAAGRLPDTQCICIADSEADIYELLAEPREAANGRCIDFVFRACRNRALEMACDDETDATACVKASVRQAPAPRYLREALMAAPVLYSLELSIRERPAKTGLEIKGRNKPRQSRQAKLDVRAASVRLRPPPRIGGQSARLAAVTINAVIVREIDAPPGEEPVEWILLSTLPIDTIEQVKKVVEYYCVRWQIEILFKTLKSGCRIEERRFEHIERTERALGLYLIAAWRTMFVTWMGRQCPDADCQTIFEPSEWKAVWMATQRTMPPKKRPTLEKIVTLIAQLGGYVLRKNSEPGTQTVWTGMQRMHDLALAWDAFGPEARAKRS